MSFRLQTLLGDENEQAHIRNKIAGLWVELAKRSWALDWFGLDEDLLQLWSQDLIHKDFVLTVLENLSEDTFVREDATAVLRGKDLKNALLEIFTASAHFSGGIKIGDSVHHARSSDDGWLVRINEFLLQIRSGVQNKSAKSGALKGLAVIRSVFYWILTPSIGHANILSTTCQYLTVLSDPDIVTVFSSSTRHS